MGPGYILCEYHSHWDKNLSSSRTNNSHKCLIFKPKTWVRFHEKSKIWASLRMSPWLKPHFLDSADPGTQMDFTKGRSAETQLESTFI